jgi:hypothetical protein
MFPPTRFWSPESQPLKSRIRYRVVRVGLAGVLDVAREHLRAVAVEARIPKIAEHVRSRLQTTVKGVKTPVRHSGVDSDVLAALRRQARFETVWLCLGVRSPESGSAHLTG